MRITSIQVHNFKSLVDFNLDLPKFTCLVGLNGSGKSTVLQFIDFLSQLMRGKIDEWLDARGWQAGELPSKLAAKKNIEFTLDLDAEKPGALRRWSAIFNPKELRCTEESIELPGTRLWVSKGKFLIEPYGAPAILGERGKSAIPFRYQGSILSQLRDANLGGELIAFREFVQSIHSLDMLSPHYLRQRTRESAGSLGLGGQKLAAFLYQLEPKEQRHLNKLLKSVYPQLQDLHTTVRRAGWKQLEITEKYQGRESGFFPKMITEARHINDGMLRLIAIFAELQSRHRFVLFDEIENGINPEVVEFVLNALVETDQQVMVTTHSPMILNYLDDEVAKAGVMYLYKSLKGHTRSIPFFSIPSIAEKLKVMGPGEAFVDTDLKKLAEEIAETTAGGA